MTKTKITPLYERPPMTMNSKARVIPPAIKNP